MRRAPSPRSSHPPLGEGQTALFAACLQRQTRTGGLGRGRRTDHNEQIICTMHITPTCHARACPGHPVAAAGGVPLRKTPPQNTNTTEEVLRRMTARAARLLDCRIKSGNDGGGLEPAPPTIVTPAKAGTHSQRPLPQQQNSRRTSPQQKKAGPFQDRLLPYPD